MTAADGTQDDQHPLDREVVEVPGVLHQCVDQAALLALVRDERVPDDDLGLLQHPEELRQQQHHGRNGDEQQVDEVSDAAADGPPQRLDEPPRRNEQHGDHAAGDVHGEHTQQRQHGKRDAVAVPQCGHDQRHSRHGDP